MNKEINKNERKRFYCVLFHMSTCCETYVASVDPSDVLLMPDGRAQVDFQIDDESLSLASNCFIANRNVFKMHFPKISGCTFSFAHLPRVD